MKSTMSNAGRERTFSRVLVTGATGFIGRQVCLRLARDGVKVVAWVRSPDAARASLGDAPELLATSADDAELEAVLRRCDAVIHLAGAGIVDKRWSAARKAELRSSRVDTTKRIADALVRSGAKAALVSASAIGWYGARGDEVLDEDSSAGVDFLGGLCRDWEQGARDASAHGVRVAIVRIGVVLGLGGGALEKLLPPFRFGLGGRLGAGTQWMSWIHAEDLVELLVTAARDERYEGVFNAVAPVPVTNREFTRELGRALRRPTPFPVPAIALRIALGEASVVLLTGQRVVPRRAQALGFTFRFPSLDAALGQLVGPTHSVRLGPAREVPRCPYLESSKPRYLLEQRTSLPAPLDEVFDFFSRAENLGAITPGSMRFRMLGERGQPMREGREIDYAIRVGPVPMRWRSRIEAWRPGEGFVDSQLRGPYACWWHEHRFTRGPGDTTVMVDRVWYAPPLGPLGALAQRALIASQLEGIFRYREHAVALRFGRAAPADSRADSRAGSPAGSPTGSPTGSPGPEAAPVSAQENGPRALTRS
jgi:hypothetical protein